jgi:hypothetical protein
VQTLPQLPTLPVPHARLDELPETRRLVVSHHRWGLQDRPDELSQRSGPETLLRIVAKLGGDPEEAKDDIRRWNRGSVLEGPGLNQERRVPPRQIV